MIGQSITHLRGARGVTGTGEAEWDFFLSLSNPQTLKTQTSEPPCVPIDSQRVPNRPYLLFLGWAS
jgi:hypothetical protein